MTSARTQDIGNGVLATDYAKLITGDSMYIDGGYHILGQQKPRAGR